MMMIKNIPKVRCSELNPVPETCQICLIDYDEDDELKVLRCKHGFHPDCLDKWLVRKLSCPLCRRSVN
jgi:hypothetical protein